VLAYTTNALMNNGSVVPEFRFNIRANLLKRFILKGVKQKCCSIAELRKLLGLTTGVSAGAAGRFVKARYRRGILRKFFCRTPWPYCEFASAIRAHTAKFRVNTVCAERAFKRANSCVPRFVG
jgi:hypothetical protein